MVRERWRLDIKNESSIAKKKRLGFFFGRSLFLQGLLRAGSGVDHRATVVVAASLAHVVGLDWFSTLPAFGEVHLFEGVVGATVPFGMFVVMLNRKCHKDVDF